MTSCEGSHRRVVSKHVSPLCRGTSFEVPREGDIRHCTRPDVSHRHGPVEGVWDSGDLPTLLHLSSVVGEAEVHEM